MRKKGRKENRKGRGRRRIYSCAEVVCAHEDVGGEVGQVRLLPGGLK